MDEETRRLICKLQSDMSDLQELSKCDYVTIWAEQNNNITTNNWNYSWGNGNEQAGTGDPVDWGYVTHYPYEIVSLTMGMRLSNTADSQAEITINGASVGQSVTITGTDTKAVDNTVYYSGPAGDTINFKTLAVGGGTDVVVSAMIKYTLP